ncbi:MAG: glycosyltransferase family 2 protein [Acidobacteria bacterium]|nr:glycosyltransferase family 2 protein [Acidobacteriota bacterium]
MTSQRDSSPIRPSGEGAAPALSVVVPAYNERENVAPLLERIHKALKKKGFPYEIIVVDDGSTDGTFERLRQAQQTDPCLRVGRFAENRGQTHAMAAGFRLARGQAVATLDADLQNNPEDILRLLPLLDRWDAVCGIRARRNDNWFRRLSSKIGNGFRNWVTRDDIVDTGCTLKVYRRECVQDLELYRGLHRFLPTLIKMRGWRVTQVPVSHSPRLYGKTKYNARNRIWKGMGDCLAVRWMKRNRIALEAVLEEYDHPATPLESPQGASARTGARTGDVTTPTSVLKP